MKNRKSRILFLALLTLVALLLSACQVNFITDIKKDGSGLYTQEIGFKADEASMAGLTAGDDTFCAKQNNELPPGTSIRQETRNKDETWCIFETSFDSLDSLKTIYGTTDTRVNDISIADGKLTFDITLDLSSDSSSSTNMPTGGEITWIVTMPGKVIENNATEQEGNTLKWKLLVGQANNIRAVSQTSGGTSLSGNTLWYVIGGVSLCLCGLVVVIIVGVVIFLVRRKKKAPAVQMPIETPIP